ncbi:uncharacterized protein LOC144213758 [Stigmatopora nigra]
MGEFTVNTTESRLMNYTNSSPQERRFFSSFWSDYVHLVQAAQRKSRIRSGVPEDGVAPTAINLRDTSADKVSGTFWTCTAPTDGSALQPMAFGHWRDLAGVKVQRMMS